MENNTYNSNSLTYNRLTSALFQLYSIIFNIAQFLVNYFLLSQYQFKYEEANKQLSKLG